MIVTFLPAGVPSSVASFSHSWRRLNPFSVSVKTRRRSSGEYARSSRRESTRGTGTRANEIR